MTKYAVWDIDNCLADDKWRAHLIDWNKHGNERYDRYNQQMFDDPAHQLAEFRFMCRFTTPVFFTGRVEKWREATIKWLTRNGYLAACGGNFSLFMRGNEDNAIPAVLKERMLERFLAGIWPNGNEAIVAAFDDIPAIIDMYQQHGIASCLLQINSDLSGIYLPNELASVSTHA